MRPPQRSLQGGGGGGVPGATRGVEALGLGGVGGGAAVPRGGDRHRDGWVALVVMTLAMAIDGCILTTTTLLQ